MNDVTATAWCPGCAATRLLKSLNGRTPAKSIWECEGCHRYLSPEYASQQVGCAKAIAAAELEKSANAGLRVAEWDLARARRAIKKLGDAGAIALAPEVGALNRIADALANFIASPMAKSIGFDATSTQGR